MVLSDSETKEFYEAFEKLEKEINKMSDVKVFNLITPELVSAIRNSKSLTEQIHKIIYEDLEN